MDKAEMVYKLTRVAGQMEAASMLVGSKGKVLLAESVKEINAILSDMIGVEVRSSISGKTDDEDETEDEETETHIVPCIPKYKIDCRKATAYCESYSKEKNTSNLALSYSELSLDKRRVAIKARIGYLMSKGLSYNDITHCLPNCSRALCAYKGGKSISLHNYLALDGLYCYVRALPIADGQGVEIVWA